MMRYFRLIFVIWLMAFGVMTPAAGVEATQQSTPEAVNRMVAIYPADSGPGNFVTVTVNVGETKGFTIIVGNAGNIKQSIRAYPIPALTADNGGFSAAPYGTELDETTSWLDITEMTMEFEPGEGREVVVDITVPADTPPGEYITAIAAEQADAYEIEGTEVMTQRVRIPMPVLITVPGEFQPSFELTSAEMELRDDMIIGIVKIENTGTAIVRLHGVARLLNEEGEVLGVSEIHLEPIFVNTSANVYVSWQNVPSLDTYGLQIELQDPDNLASDDVTFDNLTPFTEREAAAAATPVAELAFTRAELEPLTDDVPPSMLTFEGEISNPGAAIENARVTIVTYQDGREVDRYPIMQAVTIQTGSTSLESRYSLPGGFTDGTYTFEVTIEVGDMSTQTVLLTEPLEFEVVVP
jgi:hypothetical protein